MMEVTYPSESVHLPSLSSLQLGAAQTRGPFFFAHHTGHRAIPNESQTIVFPPVKPRGAHEDCWTFARTSNRLTPEITTMLSTDEPTQLNRSWNIITAYGAEPSDDADLWQIQARACMKVRRSHDLHARLAREDGLASYSGNDVVRWIEEGRA